MPANLPPAGWGMSVATHNPTYTMHGPSFNAQPPILDGYVAYWIARHGMRYTVWTFCTIEEEVTRKANRKVYNESRRAARR